MNLPPQSPDDDFQVTTDRGMHARSDRREVRDLPPQVATPSLDRSFAAPSASKRSLDDPEAVPAAQLAIWKGIFGDTIPSRAADLIAWACQDTQRAQVLSWVWAGGANDPPKFPIVLHPTAAENAALAGNIRGLDWLWAANERFGKTGPMIATPRFSINASLGGNTQVLEWMIAHARSSPQSKGLIIHHSAAAVDSASQAGNLNVLSWWWDASTRNQDRLEFLYSAAAVEGAAANKQWRTLRWWCEHRDSHGLWLLYDPLRLKPAALGILDAVPGQVVTPRRSDPGASA
ncbi:hypothetical protein BC828DRAFT_436388 [Blastocladiella britannica]|nr:hypothetical protein BC828DRAFT_436388 [Blastocladiella britannica]